MSTKPANSTLAAPAKPGKTAKPIKQKTWKDLSSQAIQDRLSTSVHFSSKPVNTNARAAGIRLGKDARLDWPLIGLVSTALDRHVVDYQDGAVAGALLSQCASVIEGRVSDDYKDVPAEQLSLVEKHRRLLDQHAEVGTGSLDARLRQVLFPMQDGQYVSLTPLHSSVFSAHLRNTLNAEIEIRAAAGDPSRRMQTLVMTGGSKAQNVGRIGLVGAMQRPLVFSAPKEDRALRAAYALYYKGVRIESLVERKTVTALAAWREANRSAEGQIESTAALRKEEEAFLHRIAHEASEALEAQRAIVAPYVEQLGGWASEELDTFTRSLLDRDERDRNWTREFAIALLRVIEQHKTARNERPLAGYGDIDDYRDMLVEGLK